MTGLAACAHGVLHFGGDLTVLLRDAVEAAWKGAIAGVVLKAQPVCEFQHRHVFVLVHHACGGALQIVE